MNYQKLLLGKWCRFSSVEYHESFEYVSFFYDYAVLAIRQIYIFCYVLLVKVLVIVLNYSFYISL